jgi:hypothetical protein
LILTAIVDLAAGRTSLADEVPHLLAVAGWGLIAYLAAVVPPMPEAPAGGLMGRARAWLAGGGEAHHLRASAPASSTLAPSVRALRGSSGASAATGDVPDYRERRARAA